MRNDYEKQAVIGEVAIENLKIDPHCRDNATVLVLGLAALWQNKAVLNRVLKLVERCVAKHGRQDTGRWVLSYWQIVVLGLFKQARGCDYDRLPNQANHHLNLRVLLGIENLLDGGWLKLSTVRRNVALLDEATLKAINAEIVGLGHEVADHGTDEVLHCRAAEVERLYWLGRKLSDQVCRRVLKEQKIPYAEKVFSIHQPHIRWINKGKAGKPVELGVPTCIMEDQHQFIVNYRIMWEGHDRDVIGPLLDETQRHFPNVRTLSLDKGFSSDQVWAELAPKLDLLALPMKGRLTAEETQREANEQFVAARKQHPAIESAIHHLESHGADKILSHGTALFGVTFQQC